MINGIKKIDADRFGMGDNSSPANLKQEILSFISDDEIVSLPIDELNALLEIRCKLYNNDYKNGCSIILKRREELMGLKDKTKQKEYQRDYWYVRRERIKRYELKMDVVEDADIITHLDRQPIKSDYLKDLIRADIKRR